MAAASGVKGDAMDGGSLTGRSRGNTSGRWVWGREEKGGSLSPLLHLGSRTAVAGQGDVGYRLLARGGGDTRRERREEGDDCMAL